MDAKRIGGWAGIIGPTLFVSVFAVEGAIRPGYHPASMFVSALSLGPRGWIQISNFIVFGSLFLLFARGVRAQFPDGKASKWGPILLTIIGVSFLASGPCVMDPQGIQFPQMTWHGKLHSLFGALVFSLGPATCFIFFRRFRADAEWRALKVWSFAAGTMMLIAVVLMKIATLPPPAPPSALLPWVGLIQRIAIVTYMLWTATIGLTMLRRSGSSA